ncbi:transposase-like protein [Pontibacter aydingkolensis]|uniref:Uncharacterized protein n=1 Tax=Pontibacter aydingkolensis TaxID=1911536 RepID=A0ABS7CRM0_9BACT|nr:hypothetical protein [Pontibacter aydingkolensis]MBW7466351.1 hypothetical protein [Pontibacter aydingkolensis]
MDDNLVELLFSSVENVLQMVNWKDLDGLTQTFKEHRISNANCYEIARWEEV